MVKDSERFDKYSQNDLAAIATKLCEEAPLFFFTLAQIVKLEKPAPIEYRPWITGDTVTFIIPKTDETCCITFTRAELNELRAYGHDQKVECIKHIRKLSKVPNIKDYSGMGLLEAKRLCESFFKAGNLALYNHNPDGSIAY